MDKRDFARQLRCRSTDAERLLWRHLRRRRLADFKFRRQEPVGTYVPDFVCYEGRLIVELDGGQHADDRAYDERRDAWLASQGFRVLRFPDNLCFDECRGRAGADLADARRKSEGWRRVTTFTLTLTLSRQGRGDFTLTLSSSRPGRGKQW